MMKNISKLAALAVATAFLLAGFPACSGEDDGDGDPTLAKIEISIDTEKVKTEYAVGAEFDKAGITVTATYSNGVTQDVTDKAEFTAKVGDTAFTTEAAGDFNVTLTATYEGKTVSSDPCKITVKSGGGGNGEGEGNGDGNGEGNGNGDNSGNEEGNGNGEGDGNGGGEEDKGTTYAWNFQAKELSTVLSFAKADDGKDCLDAEGTYEATPAGLTLVLPKDLKFNSIEPGQSAGSTTNGASDGAIQPLQPTEDGDGDIYVEVQGPFTAEMLYASNGGDKTDRTAYIKIGGEKKAVSEGKLTNAGGKLTASYDGTDTVKVSFGGTNYIRIYDIKITTKNGDGTGKTAGEVISKAVFTTTTDDSTANDVATLGLVGTGTPSSSDPEVAVAEITDGKIVITSVSKAGTATITVANDEGNEAIIKVTVIGTGKITSIAVTKYRAPVEPGAALPWTAIGGEAVDFTEKAIVISKNSGIFLPVTYKKGQKVVLSFTVDKDSVNKDSSNKICGGFAQDESFGSSILAVFASNKGISNGSKIWNNGGSSNGYSNSTNLWTGKTEAQEDVTFTVTYTIGQESDTGSDVVLIGSITDGTTTDKKECTQKQVYWNTTKTAGIVQESVVPYISFGSGATDSITVSNITLTVDGEPVATTAD